MGLFDDEVGGAKSAELTKADAFAGILLGASAVDGHISDEEAQNLVATLTRMKLYDNWTSDKLVKTINRMMGMIKREGAEEVLVRCARAVPKELHKTAFANACDIVLADGTLEDEEKEFVNKLWKALGLASEEAHNIAQVMMIKNRG